jgi:hypothetical protein
MCTCLKSRVLQSITKSRFAVNNRLLITWRKNRFRNRVTRRDFQSIIFFTVAFCSERNNVSRSRFAVNGIALRLNRTPLDSVTLSNRTSEFEPVLQCMIVDVVFVLTHWNVLWHVKEHFNQSWSDAGTLCVWNTLQHTALQQMCVCVCVCVCVTLGGPLITMSWVWVQHCLVWVELRFSTHFSHDQLFSWVTFFGGGESARVSREIVARWAKGYHQEDRTISNHFHGLSSASEAQQHLRGQTDQSSWLLLRDN